MSAAPGNPVVPYASRPDDAPLRLAAQGRAWLSADPLLRGLSAFAAVCILGMIGVLVGVLFWASIPSIRTFGFSFLYSTEWRPNEREIPKRGLEG